MSENKKPALCMDTLRWAANVIHNELRGGGPLAMKLNLLPQEVETVAEQINDILLKEPVPKDNKATTDEKKPKDVHTEHCCINCGCKYGEDVPRGVFTECSVVNGSLEQSYSCGRQGICNGH